MLFAYNEKMYTNRDIGVTLCLFLLLLPASPYSVNAAPPTAKVQDSIQAQKEKQFCGQIQEKIKNTKEVRKIVKTSIQMGYDACAVIHCAIKGGGNLRQVISGAIDAGATKDIVSRCALDAGAEAKDVAAILGSVSAPGICYMLPEEPEIIVPPTPVVISPSKF